MNCPDRRQWDDLLAGSITLRESDYLIKHATDCEDCACHLDTLTGQDQLLRAALTAGPDTAAVDLPSLIRAVLQELDEPEAP